MYLPVLQVESALTSPSAIINRVLKEFELTHLRNIIRLSSGSNWIIDLQHSPQTLAIWAILSLSAYFVKPKAEKTKLALALKVKFLKFLIKLFLMKTKAKKFNVENYLKVLHEAAGTFTAKNHPEWATKKKVEKWLLETRMNADRDFSDKTMRKLLRCSNGKTRKSLL